MLLSCRTPSARPSLVRLLHRYYIRGLGRIPTPPSRACPASAFRLPGPDCSTQPKRRSPGSRAYGFPACWALRLREIPNRLALNGGCDVAFPFRQQGRHPKSSFSELNPPAHRFLCLRFHRYLTIATAKLEARMVSLFLSCRALSSPTVCRFIPAHCRALFFLWTGECRRLWRRRRWIGLRREPEGHLAERP